MLIDAAQILPRLVEDRAERAIPLDLEEARYRCDGQKAAPQERCLLASRVGIVDGSEERDLSGTRAGVEVAMIGLPTSRPTRLMPSRREWRTIES